MRLAAPPTLLVLAPGGRTVATTIGAAGIPLHRIAAATGLTHGDPSLIARDWLVLWSIRLPRIALAVIIGGLLAASGTVMQGLFRNPLADPALVGVSSGAGLAAASTIVVGDHYLAAAGVALPIEALPVAAFGGALIATLVLYRIATREGRTSIAMFLLGGLAIAALANAGLRASRVSRRRPSTARHQFLDARLAQRRDLGQGRRDCAVPRRRGARAALCLARTRPAGARRDRSFPCRDRGRTPQARCVVLVAAATGAAVSVAA